MLLLVVQYQHKVAAVCSAPYGSFCVPGPEGRVPALGGLERPLQEGRTVVKLVRDVQLGGNIVVRHRDVQEPLNLRRITEAGLHCPPIVATVVNLHFRRRPHQLVRAGAQGPALRRVIVGESKRIFAFPHVLRDDGRVVLVPEAELVDEESWVRTVQVDREVEIVLDHHTLDHVRPEGRAVQVRGVGDDHIDRELHVVGRERHAVGPLHAGSQHNVNRVQRVVVLERLALPWDKFTRVQVRVKQVLKEPFVHGVPRVGVSWQPIVEALDVVVLRPVSVAPVGEDQGPVAGYVL